MSTRTLFIAFLIAIFVPTFAMADNYDWSFAATNLSGSGVLSASATGTPGTYDITGGSGTVTFMGTAFSVTFAPCTYPTVCTLVNTDGAGANLSFDNYLFPGNAPGNQLDSYGIALQPGPAGTTAMGIWDTPSQEFFSYGTFGYQNLSTPFTVTPTPEPSSACLLLSAGLAALAGIKRRMR
jgi:hypothetical protein